MQKKPSKLSSWLTDQLAGFRLHGQLPAVSDRGPGESRSARQHPVFMPPQVSKQRRGLHGQLGGLKYCSDLFLQACQLPAAL